MFAGHTVTLLVLSCRGSFKYFETQFGSLMYMYSVVTLVSNCQFDEYLVVTILVKLVLKS